MLTNDEVLFLRGVVTDSGYPYYVVYPESFGANNRLIHIYLSKTPVTVSDDTFSINDGLYMQMSHDEYIKIVSSGNDFVFKIPVDDTMCYTSTPNTPLYPTLWQASADVSQTVDINYPKIFLFIFAAVLIGGFVKSILFGGK